MNQQETMVWVSGADEGYVMPLAVTIRSAIDHLSPDRRAEIYILDGGITRASKDRMERSWQDDRISVHWVSAEGSDIEGLPVSLHVTSSTYLRLAIAERLPSSVDRAIYLDADMLVCRDLSLLWDEPQGDASVLAVQDYAAPWIDSTRSLSASSETLRYLATSRPIANFEELGIDEDAMYFNGGLLVIDVKRWREERIFRQFLDCLSDHRQHVLWWDQYALNVVLAGKWRSLDLRWNQGAHLFSYPGATQSPFDSDTFQMLHQDPWVVHFCSPEKPWNYFCHHPATADFFRTLRDTAWSGYTPPRPEQYLRRLWGYHYKPVRAHWKFRTRCLKSMVGYRRRAA
ncbi:General stress protein A [Rubripirellula lacrimiformis]|uniref:General stress protein A n=1 Tax=Rubripirellula lacrimiformis TaxID=1930273 RepID=A0A517NEZ0_9BACT|nr:glycosyltransferase family 8 protein [Rubripirellula lacrimiformis]QDT05697.1 General stress protein A [Rubripirellula lacrimiformis]